MLKPIPNHYDYFGRQINEGDVYSAINDDKELNDAETDDKYYYVCLWFPQFFRHAWLPFGIYQEQRIITDEEVYSPTSFFTGEETYEGNIFSNPDLIAA